MCKLGSNGVVSYNTLENCFFIVDLVVITTVIADGRLNIGLQITVT